MQLSQYAKGLQFVIKEQEQKQMHLDDDAVSYY
jgi:hypothetical protein